MATYRMSATVRERYGVFHVRVVATSDATDAGVIIREHECYSDEAATMSLEVLIDQVRDAIAAIGAEVEGKGLPEIDKPAE